MIATGMDLSALTEKYFSSLYEDVSEDIVNGRLTQDGAVRILVYADLPTIKERFKDRMHGNLPAPVAQMLEKKHGIFDDGSYDYRFDGVNGDAASLCDELKTRC